MSSAIDIASRLWTASWSTYSQRSIPGGTAPRRSALSIRRAVPCSAVSASCHRCCARLARANREFSDSAAEGCIRLPVWVCMSASFRSERSTNCPSAAGLAKDCVVSSLSCTRRRNSSCRTPNSRSINANAGIARSEALMSRRNTSRSKPASVAVSNSSSVYDTSGLSRTGEPYRVPSTPTYTLHPRTTSAQSSAGVRSAAGKSFMSTITCPAAETARSTAAT